MNENEYITEKWIDFEYQLYVDAWLAYHRAAQEIDGHIKHPFTPEEHKLVGMAKRAGIYAQQMFLLRSNFTLSLVEPIKWQQAKLEALRILDKEKG